MTKTTGKLQLVAEDKLNSVLEFLEQDLPLTVSIYNSIRTLSDWKRKTPHIQFDVYCIGGDPNNGCVFCHGQYSQYSHYYLVYSRQDENPALLNLLKEFDIPCNDGKALMFQAVNEKNCKLVEELCKVKNLSFLKPFVNYNFWLPPETSKNIQIECPVDLYVDFLDIAHAEVINDSWPHKFEGSLDYIRTTIQLNFGLGLFRKVDKQVVSFGLFAHYGGIGMLYTLEEFRRKGYAAIVILAISKELVARGLNPHAYVLHVNKPSAALFRKLGFEVADNITWYANV